ncbi:MAG: peptide-methionine (R)-S-oxide reductase MsrB [Candidatus Colwellbacteria bacterium]
MTKRAEISEEELKERLSPMEYKVLREKGTEPPFRGEYVDMKDKGIYMCKVCKAELFDSEAKFDSHTGWPSFTEPKNRENVELEVDTSAGMERVEVLCKSCGSHLGHVFDDGPKERGGKRFCINSCALELGRG